MKKGLLISSLILLLPMLALADGMTNCDRPAYLTNGFNMADYQQCSTLLQQCPKNGAYTDLTCVEKTIQAQASCAQLSNLAESVQAAATQLSAGSIGQQITALTVLFPADGKKQYYLISHDGCLINTVVDPRSLNPLLTQQYANMSLLFSNADQLEYIKEVDGTQSVKAHISFTQDCAACKVVGNAEIKFNFTQDGDFKALRLHNFDTL